MLTISISFLMGVDMNVDRINKLLIRLEAAQKRGDELSRKEIQKQIDACRRDIPIRTGTGRIISRKTIEEKGQ